jgi:hypothetical protein
MKSLSPEKAEQVMSAISRLVHNTDFQFVLTEWLNASFEDQKIINIGLRGEEATRGQGYAEALRDMTAPLKNPDSLIKKMKEIKKLQKNTELDEW